MAYTKESFDNRLKKLFPKSNFTTLKYSGIKKEFTFQCNRCGVTHTYQEADKIIDRSRRGLEEICVTCADTAQLQPRTEVINKINNLLPKTHIQLLEKIKRANSDVQWRCKKCNHIFNRAPINFLKTQKCPWCEGYLYKHTIDTIEKSMLEQWGTEYQLLSKEYNSKKSNRIRVKHDSCGFIYNVNVYSLLKGHGCPRCKSSKGERKVRQYLDKHNFYYIEQYSFKNSEISTLKFDFYLEENNQKFAIEYNGRQHYVPVDYFGGETAFLQQIQRDKRKKEYCKENNITLITIPYNDESILTKDLLAQRLYGQVP